MNRHNRRAAKARGNRKDEAFARAICELAKIMEQWRAENPTAELRWHLLPQPPPFGLATSDPGARSQLANSPDADRMLRESDAGFARKTGNASTLYMARTALALVKQLPHIDQLDSGGRGAPMTNDVMMKSSWTPAARAHDIMTDKLSVDLRRLVEESAALVLLLSELGFEPHEVLVGPRNVLNVRPPGPCATVTVSRAGLEHVIVIATLRGDRAGDDFADAWRAFCVRPLPSDDAIRMLQASSVKEQELIESLKAAGFAADAWDDNANDGSAALDRPDATVPAEEAWPCDGGLNADCVIAFASPGREESSKMTADDKLQFMARVREALELVESTAWRLRRTLGPSADVAVLMSCGRAAVSKAAEGYDSSLGCSFETYAKRSLELEMLKGFREELPRADRSAPRPQSE